ncbi:MAG: 4Fe-4S dicluster domain-containing protein [Candidatus Lokiarchaeota archaeon]|nr:4Fe-4S dicluster domain-containing protein [Candidatus Lokiarchaeota archaeon]MBD3338155.1 4Fe-4S dicluster domain-containing protein [Candidatus Lokiarchaeota archaeon]
MEEKQIYKLARKIIKAGELPIPVNKPIINLLKLLINEEQLNFLLKFRKPSYTYEQIKHKSGLDDKNLTEMLNTLMHIGMITGIPSRRTGIMIYRLVGFLPGMLEFTLMRGEKGKKQKQIAKIWESFFKDLHKGTQRNYNQVVAAFKNAPPFDRVVPVDEEIELFSEKVFPFEDVKKIIEKYDIIGVSHCYCRHLKDLLNEPCKLNAPRRNCLSFGRTAQFCIEHGFSEKITKQEALKILQEAEETGLVHKAIHNHSNPELEEVGLCNCCKCCCGNFQNYYTGTSPTSTLTSYIVKLNRDLCLGCGTCVNICPMEAIELNESIASIDLKKCIGCGLCAYHCPEAALSLKRTGLRTVFVPPPKIKSE